MLNADKTKMTGLP